MIEKHFSLILISKKFIHMIQPISAIFSNLKYKENFCHKVIKIPFDSKSQVSHSCTSLFLQEWFRQLPILTTNESVENQALFLFTSTSYLIISTLLFKWNRELCFEESLNDSTSLKTCCWNKCMYQTQLYNWELN